MRWRLSLVLLVSVGLLIRSVARFAAAPLKTGVERLITLSLRVPAKTYSTNKQIIRFYTEFIDRLRALPEVKQVSLTTMIPLWGGYGMNAVERQDRPRALPGHGSAGHGGRIDLAGILLHRWSTAPESRAFHTRDGERADRLRCSTK
jgi:hypothetical protein